MSTRPRARTVFEMNFSISLQACPHCGKRVDPEPLKLYGDNTTWSITGTCKQCGKPVAFPFQTQGDPLQAERKYFELGQGRSELIAPGTFIAEIDHLASTLTSDVSELSLPDWNRNRDANRRMSICVTELSRFIEPGSDSIADAALSEADQAARQTRPRPYSRGWIEEMTALHQRVSAAIQADMARVDTLERTQDTQRPKGGVDWLDREHLQAHEKWVERGQKGRGRLLLVGAVHDEMNVGRGVELTGARFFDVSMPKASLEDAKLHGAELTDVSFEGGRLYGAELRDAKVIRGSFKRATLETAELQNVSIDGTDFTETELHFSEWAGAHIVNATFERATFGDANLDGATFKACNFRSADLGADDPTRPPTTKAVFEDCDLRDSRWEGRDLSSATFVRCKLANMSGPAAAVESVKIVDADISTAEALRLWASSKA